MQDAIWSERHPCEEHRFREAFFLYRKKVNVVTFRRRHMNVVAFEITVHDVPSVFNGKPRKASERGLGRIDSLWTQPMQDTLVILRVRRRIDGV